MIPRKHPACREIPLEKTIQGSPGADNPHLKTRDPLRETCRHAASPLKLETVSGRRVWIESYGCTYNMRDGEMLAAVLSGQGCRIVEHPDEAEIVVINTCVVTAATERAMMRRIDRCRGREVILTGCLPAAGIEEAGPIAGQGFIHPEEIHKAFRCLGAPPPSAAGIVQVATGCAGRCTYCITRVARGTVTSNSPDRIAREVQSAVEHGVAEIRLTAQDVAAYGLDTGIRLQSLLGQVVSVAGNSMVRVGMMNPATTLPILSDLVPVWDHPNIFRFLHLPVQSGSEQVLNAMGRGYSPGDAMRIVWEFRKRMPDLFLMTDVICGFPGETDDDFLETCDVIRQIRPDKVNVTRFSKRPGTAAAQLHDLPDRIKKERSRRVQSLAEAIYHEKNAGMIGSVVPVIVTEVVKEGSVTCRTPAYRGVVVPGTYPAGTRMDIRVIHDRTYFFTGEPAGTGRGP